ncbi:TPA: RAMP superfamily CRISPR-associated protein [Clostridioides difficile]|uniref:RAMP superfamily CRISPR-associated protein n=1 Tax=Clostridioides difficile TaxID=1496 RepID=UPI0004070CEC|nr:RAMP superfamily CRISPR-associated protein [Clostridioides difficile]
MKINIKLKLLSSLMHFDDENIGNMQITRMLKFKYNDEYIYIPVYSANSFRGILRRLIMKDYLENVDSLKITAKLYHSLFSGGSLVSGKEYCDMEEMKNARDMCPPVSVLGTIIGNTMYEGKLKIGIFKPICKELVDYTGIESNMSFYEMLEEVYHVRTDSLKSSKTGNSNIEIIGENNEKIQMKYEMQSLCAGSELISHIYLENMNEIEKSCVTAMLELFERKPFIGGKTNIGYGEVKIEYDKEHMVSSKLYYDYLKENKESILNWITVIESKLK